MNIPRWLQWIRWRPNQTTWTGSTEIDWARWNQFIGPVYVREGIIGRYRRFRWLKRNVGISGTWAQFNLSDAHRDGVVLPREAALAVQSYIARCPATMPAGVIQAMQLIEAKYRHKRS